MTGIRIGDQQGGRQAARRQRLTRLRFGPAEAAATVIVLGTAALAIWLVGTLHLAAPEALARTARLASLWQGFDTNITAIGYDRPPLLTLLAAPFAAVPALRDHGLATALASSLTMAVGVLGADRLAIRSGLHTRARVLFVLAFGLNPLLVYAAATGQPEALYAGLLLAATGEFVTWLQRESVGSVIGCGVAVGLAFLVRYEVLLWVPLFAWAFTWAGTRAATDEEEHQAPGASALAFLVPVCFFAGLWTLVNWLGTGTPFTYLDAARQVAGLGSDSVAILERMVAARGDILRSLAWTGAWNIAFGLGSVGAVILFLARGYFTRDRAMLAVGLVLLAILATPALVIVNGGQVIAAHHLITVIPMFIAIAFIEGRRTHGTVPGAHETARRRTQTTLAAMLLVLSLASAAAIPMLPAGEIPGSAAIDAVRDRRPLPPTEGTEAVVEFLRREAGPGDVLVDSNRHAEVMLGVGDPRRFRTDADRGQEATLFDPAGLARFILVRRPLPGQGDGRIEHAHPGVFEEKRPFLQIQFAAGDYRLYRVTGPAIP